MINSSEITTYIPQRDPFIMVSELCSADENKALSRFLIPNEGALCENGYFLEAGIIENIAQTAAAMNGYNAIKNNETIKKGYIGGINHLAINKLPKSGTEIETEVTIEHRVMNVHIIRGIVKQKEIIIAECEMKIFLEI